MIFTTEASMEDQSMREMLSSWQREDDRDACTARFVRAMASYYAGDDGAAKAWTREALMLAPVCA